MSSKPISPPAFGSMTILDVMLPTSHLRMKTFGRTIMGRLAIYARYLRSKRIACSGRPTDERWCFLEQLRSRSRVGKKSVLHVSVSALLASRANTVCSLDAKKNRLDVDAEIRGGFTAKSIRSLSVCGQRRFPRVRVLHRGVHFPLGGRDCIFHTYPLPPRNICIPGQ